jgi:hypothetical protein
MQRGAVSTSRHGCLRPPAGLPAANEAHADAA